MSPTEARMARTWRPRNDLPSLNTPPHRPRRIVGRTWRPDVAESPSEEVVVRRHSRHASELERGEESKTSQENQAHHPLFPRFPTTIDREVSAKEATATQATSVVDESEWSAEMPPELWLIVYEHCLMSSFAIRSLPAPGITEVHRAARELWLRSSTFCLSTEPMAAYQKRKRLFMRQVTPKPSEKSLALLEYFTEKDVREIKRIAFLVGGYERPLVRRFWLTVVHFKDGLRDFEVTESKEVEQMDEGACKEEIVFQWVDWDRVPKVETVLGDMAKAGKTVLSKELLRKVMDLLCFPKEASK